VGGRLKVLMDLEEFMSSGTAGPEQRDAFQTRIHAVTTAGELKCYGAGV
jgi:hypothetical protein